MNALMKILAIDTATSLGSIALVEGAVLRAQYALDIAATHNQRLLPGIDRILTDASRHLDELDALAVSLGPGSFTGLRIGLSVMKGLAWSTGKPLVGVPTLDALAANAILTPQPICPILDARKGEIYTALYRRGKDWEPERLTPYMVVAPEKLKELIVEKTVVVGDGLRRYGTFLSGLLGTHLLWAPPQVSTLSASCVAWLAWQRLRRGEVEDVSACAPIYVRASEAELDRSKTG
jgi:tRNA threonylcarbamoyladenosine biosynthesis protein TsaB